MRRILLLLMGLTICLLCGFAVLHHRYSPSALRKAAFERIENGMSKDAVIALLGPPDEEYWSEECFHGVMLWGLGSDFHKDGHIHLDLDEPGKAEGGSYFYLGGTTPPPNARVRGKSINDGIAWTERLRRALWSVEDSDTDPWIRTSYIREFP